MLELYPCTVLLLEVKLDEMCMKQGAQPTGLGIMKRYKFAQAK